MKIVSKSQKWMPKKYQLEACKFLIGRYHGGLFIPPGGGKTSITLNNIVVLKNMKKINKILIIAPKRVMLHVWPNEIKKWDNFKHLTVSIIQGTEKQRKLALDVKADIYLINFEMIKWLITQYPTPSKFKSLGFDMLVIDELSKFKHMKSKRAKALKTVLRVFKYRWGLTGSPASNGLLDLFGQIYMLDGGVAFGKYITQFRSTYFQPIGYAGYQWVAMKGSEERIYNKLKDVVIRINAYDEIALPEAIINNIYIDLPSDARKIYEDLEDDYLSKIDSNITILAPTAAAAAMKCRQVASGAVYYTDITYEEALQKPFDKRKIQEIHSEKLDALEDLIDELQGDPLLVAYDFRFDIERFKTRFGKKAVFLDNSSMTIDAWNNGDIPVLFGHPRSIGHGLNLQGACRTVCWYTPTYDLELYEQFNGRVMRQGNKATHITIHQILAVNTLDIVAVKAIQRKGDNQNRLFKALEEYRNEKQ